LAEIELAMQQIPGIHEAAVEACEDKLSGKFLCGYYVTDKKTNPQPDSQAIKENLAAKLPDYMVPSSCFEMDSFPLTAGGKIDRNKLPVPAKSMSKNYIAPSTELEILLTQLVSRVTGINEVGLADNFIELGGDSIKAIILLSLLGKQGYDVPVADLLGRGSLGDISKKLLVKGIESSPVNPVPLVKKR